MKIVKRDGRIVEYNPEKIRIAISKANAEMDKPDMASEKQIEEIIRYIEKLNKKRMLVEDIQDIIEQKLMGFKKFNLAKHYIIYRYTRALVRKSNTTDETILSIIRNNNIESDVKPNKKAMTVASQRNLIASQISKDLTRRMLLPEKISDAHTDGEIFFHGIEFYLQPMINSSVINIQDMLNKGTVINSVKIESPNGFEVACSVLTQIISEVTKSEYGKVTINTCHLASYLRKSEIKYEEKLKKDYEDTISLDLIKSLARKRKQEELTNGIQTIIYQLNTLLTSVRDELRVTFVLNLEDNEYILENASIIEEILNQMYKGIKNEAGEYEAFREPNLVFVLNELNKLNCSKYAYLTKLAIKCSRKFPISFASKNKLLKTNMGCEIPVEDIYLPYKDENKNMKLEGRFNQGVVSINLPQIGLVSAKNEDIFFQELENRLNLCFEALMCRNHELLGVVSDTSPIHFINGGVCRLQSGEKIDQFLKNDYSTLTLSFVGICELTKYMKEDILSEEGIKFSNEVMKVLNDTCTRWRKETGLGFTLCVETSDVICSRFANIDKERFGSIKDVTSKGYYTKGYFFDSKLKLDILEKLSKEEEISDRFEVLSCLDTNISNIKEDEKLEKIIEYVYDNVKYVRFENRKEE